MTSDDKIKYQVHDYYIEPRTYEDEFKKALDKEWNWYEEVDDEFIKTSEDPVGRPYHYTTGDIECIDAMKEAFGEEALKNFCRLNAFKYLWRANNKNTEKQDIEKAIWYLRKSIGDDPRKI